MSKLTYESDRGEIFSNPSFIFSLESRENAFLLPYDAAKFYCDHMNANQDHWTKAFASLLHQPLRYRLASVRIEHKNLSQVASESQKLVDYGINPEAVRRLREISVKLPTEVTTLTFLVDQTGFNTDLMLLVSTFNRIYYINEKLMPLIRFSEFAIADETRKILGIQ